MMGSIAPLGLAGCLGRDCSTRTVAVGLWRQSSQSSVARPACEASVRAVMLLQVELMATWPDIRSGAALPQAPSAAVRACGSQLYHYSFRARILAQLCVDRPL